MCGDFGLANWGGAVCLFRRPTRLFGWNFRWRDAQGREADNKGLDRGQQVSL